MIEEVLQVRCPGVCFYVIRDSDGLYLIDAGFIGARRALSRALRDKGWANQPIKGIIISHGHLDHTLNVAAIARDSGAWVAAPTLNLDHCEGRYHYHGPSRICGILEALGRKLLRYQPPEIDRPLNDGAQFPILGGLTAIHLPGHTEGHMGFYSERLRLLFSADLFASHRRLSHLPPIILNSQPESIPASVNRALNLDLDGILPSHCDKASPAEHLNRLKKIAPKLHP